MASNKTQDGQTTNSTPSDDKTQKLGGDYLTVIAPNGDVYQFNQQDMRKYRATPEETKKVRQKYGRRGSILAVVGATMDTCVCVILNLQILNPITDLEDDLAKDHP